MRLFLYSEHTLKSHVPNFKLYDFSSLSMHAIFPSYKTAKTSLCKALGTPPNASKRTILIFFKKFDQCHIGHIKS